MSHAGRLLELTVGDLALIDRLRLTLGPGLNVITGETGAGKSLLIDALGLVRGSRADTRLVRHGAEAARVEALFDRLPEPLIAVREVATNGRSTARLDDIATTASRLADEVGPLVEIHGQHDQQRLLDERWQRDLLDAYGGHAAARAATADVVERWRANRAALAELSIDPRELARRVDLLEHEAEEIAAARLRPGEADEIRARLSAAQHGEAIARGAAAVREALTADGAGARDAAAMAVRESRGLARLDPRFEALAERLAGLEAELEDVASEVRGLADGIEHDPATLASLEERLGTIYALERRYGDGESEVIAHGERAVAELERLRNLDGERARREREDAALLAAVATAAGALSEARRTAGTALAGAVGQVLEELGFPAGVFEVALGRRSAGDDEPAIELDGDAVAFDATRRRPGRLPPRPEPRRAGTSAGADRLGRGAVARGAGHQERPGRGGRDAGPGLRRGRHGDRRPERRPGRAQPVGAGPTPPGPVRDPSAADRGPRRCPLPDRQARARRPDDHRDRAPRPRGPDRRARPDARWRRGRCRDPGQRARAPRPRRGLARRGRPGRLRPTRRVPDLAAATDDYLTYLRVERGLAPATIRAYRADLNDFAASRGVTRGWAGSPDPAVGYLAARTRRGRRGDPGLAPSSLRRRAAALKGFYRYAYGEGLIGVDVAAHLDLPRPSRLLPETLTVEEIDRLLEAAGGDETDDAPRQPARHAPGHALRDRALLELLYAAGLRISEAIGLDREDLSVDGAFVRVIGKGDKERLVPVGDVALDWLGRWMRGPRVALLAIGHVAPLRGGPLFLGDRGGRLALSRVHDV